jgi:hypothetical protein
VRGCGALWCSLCCGEKKLDKKEKLLDDWPVDRPWDWCRTVNRAQDERELEWLRQCVLRGRPGRDEAWVRRTAVKLGLENGLRPVGWPRKTPEQKRNGF